MVGVANATQIPMTVDPQNAPIVWLEDVYNGSSSSIASGLVVQWDFDTADVSDPLLDDMLNYVKLNATADGPWMAGVMATDTCAAYSVGQIIIRGPARVKSPATGTVAVVDTRCSADTAGKIIDWSGGQADEAHLGTVIKANTLGNWVIVFVDPTVQDDG